MKINKKDLERLQNQLKVGNRRGVHLNAIAGRTRLKFDIKRLSNIKSEMPQEFISALLSKSSLNFTISWKDNVNDINALSEDEQLKLYNVNSSLNNLVNDVHAIETEKGINTFGFGFPLVIRRDAKDNKITVAPLIIWSLQIVRLHELNTWQIKRNESDPVRINEVLINHLQSDSNIKINEIDESYLEDNFIDTDELLNICVEVAKNLNSSTDDNLKTVFTEKLRDIKAIADKKYYESLPLSASNSLIKFAGLFSIFSVNKHNIINDYDDLLALSDLEIVTTDLENNDFQGISSVETDPSQQGILTTLKTSRNILIQGPPGTGKSQTLTAILVNALENNKKTLVVCEKRTALEVLEQSLINKGLGGHTILIKDCSKDRRQVVDTVRRRVEDLVQKAGRLPSKQPLNNIIDTSQNLIDRINTKHSKLAVKLLDNQNWTDVVGELLRITAQQNSQQDSQQDNNIDLDINPQLFTFNSQELTEISNMLIEGYPLHQQHQKTQKLSYLQQNKLISDNKFKLEKTIATDFKNYQQASTNIKKNISDYETEYYHIRNGQLERQSIQLTTEITNVNTILTKYLEDSVFYNEKMTKGLFFRFFALFTPSKKQVLQDQQETYELYEQLIELSSNCNDCSNLEVAESIQNIQYNIEQYKHKLADTKIQFTKKITDEYTQLNLLNVTNNSVKNSLLSSINKEITTLTDKILADDWCVNIAFNSNITEQDILQIIDDIIVKHTVYNQSNDDLFSYEFAWINFYQALTDKEQQVVDALIGLDDWQTAFKAFYLTQLLMNSADNDLPTDDKDIQQLNFSLKNIEKEQLTYIQRYWSARQSKAIYHFNNISSISVEQLYSKRKTQTHNRLSLREIVKKDKDLFTTFFPIILTTPEVASNLFAGEQQFFDIIMFDEASQLKVEDNLPSLLKGKQIIIAGDEHQMPPSTYFAKQAELIDDENDEDITEEELSTQRVKNSIFEAESLLEFATDLGFQKCHLDFHYRSQHPYLIDFSNFAFYHQRLKPLPNKHDYVPISYINVGGVYVDNTNEQEANAVLDIIENDIQRLKNGEYPTIGIATFNIKQRDFILNLIYERREDEKYVDFNEKIMELENNGFFVKNLENIQGDERDIIILSTTYGQNIEGKFHQRFGSLNQQKGYRLLNVIITRAKYKLYVCSSIPEKQFLSYREYLNLENSNNKRAIFYAYLAYAKAVSDQSEESRQAVLNALAENTNASTGYENVYAELESPFEEEVHEALMSAGLSQDNIIPQFKFAGFRIDMVYDSKKQGVPKIAIECDGAKYHSSKEAYLHDRHRQKILEQHGFVFHRIWSTNWWRNPEKETQKLVDFIKSVELDTS